MHGWLQVATIETVVSETDIFGQFQHHHSGPLAEEQCLHWKYRIFPIADPSLAAVSRQSPTSALTLCHLDRLCQLAGLGRHESRQQRLSMGHSPKSLVFVRFQVAQVTCATRVVGFLRQSCRHSCHRPDIEWALSLCTTYVVDYHQGDLFDTLANNSVDVVLRRCGLCLEKPLHKLGCCLSAETHARMVFALEAREGPTTQDRAEDVVAVSSLLFEAPLPPTIRRPSDSSELHQQWVHPVTLCRVFKIPGGRVYSSLKSRNS